MKRNFFISIILLCLILPLSGCWDRIEPEKQAIVTGGGFDYNPELDMYKIIFQIVSPLTLRTVGQGGGSEKPNYWTVSAWGHSPYDAVANINKKVSRKISFSHADIYLFSKRMAEQKGILPIINAVARSRQSRRIITLGVVKKDVEKALTVSLPLESSNALGLVRQVDLTMEEMGGITAQTARDFFISLVQPGIEPYTVAIELIKPQEKIDKADPGKSSPIRVSGKYMFKDDKVVGFLNDRETRGCNWIVGKVREGTLVINYPGDKDNIIDVKATEGSSQVIPIFKNGQPSIKIKIKARGRIVNVTGLSEIKSKSQINKILNQKMTQVIRNDIEMALKKAKSVEADVFGLGYAFYRLMPDKWELMKGDWDSIFPNLPVEVEIRANIERTGLVNQGPKIQ
jgi:Ger(x)C family germination protein